MSDVFQESLDAVIKTLPGVIDIADDVLAKGDDETSHNVAGFSLVEIAENNNLKFNSDKIQFKIKDCKFFEQLLTPEVMSTEEI